MTKDEAVKFWDKYGDYEVYVIVATTLAVLERSGQIDPKEFEKCLTPIRDEFLERKKKRDTEYYNVDGPITAVKKWWNKRAS